MRLVVTLHTHRIPKYTQKIYTSFLKSDFIAVVVVELNKATASRRVSKSNQCAGRRRPKSFSKRDDHKNGPKKHAQSDREVMNVWVSCVYVFVWGATKGMPFRQVYEEKPNSKHAPENITKTTFKLRANGFARCPNRQAHRFSCIGELQLFSKGVVAAMISDKRRLNRQEKVLGYISNRFILCGRFIKVNEV